jgi:superfamily II RNA helicase
MLAAIYSKFKSVDPGKDKALIGVFTRDHIENINNCRILLTVPECLEIMYFNPAGYRDIALNVKYIVFDEFQGLNEENRGKIWERIVLFCQSPFLALSATINNPRHLCNWLNISKSISKQQQVHLIEYKQPSTEFVYNLFQKEANDGYI